MNQTQTNKILELLETGRWVCTSEMYAMFMSDPRRRLCDLKDKGYKLESRICQQHNYHNGNSKEWRLQQQKTEVPERVRIWQKQFEKPEGKVARGLF